MNRFQNAMAVFKLLPKTNCRACGAPTCLAFAAAVFQGRERLDRCPHLDPRIVAQIDDGTTDTAPGGSSAFELETLLQQLRGQIADLDLAAAADRVGGQWAGGKLTIKVLGKDFSVDAAGRLYSDIHIHGWLALPFFDYLLNCRGVPPSGRWVPLRELENGKDWDNFFVHRCEKPLKRVADTYTDLFEDMVHLFNGRPVEKHYQSDISLVLHPLPKLPVLICYWKPEDGLASSLNLFFDARAEQNLPIGSIYRICAGLVVMFEKIALRHGVIPEKELG